MDTSHCSSLFNYFCFDNGTPYANICRENKFDIELQEMQMEKNACSSPHQCSIVAYRSFSSALFRPVLNDSNDGANVTIRGHTIIKYIETVIQHLTGNLQLIESQNCT